MKISNVVMGPEVEYNDLSIKEAIEKYRTEYEFIKDIQFYYVIDEELYNYKGDRVSYAGGAKFSYKNIFVEYDAYDKVVYFAMGGVVLKLNVISHKSDSRAFYGRIYRRAESINKLMMEDFRFSAV